MAIEYELLNVKFDFVRFGLVWLTEGRTTRDLLAPKQLPATIFFLPFFLSCEHRHRLRNGHLYRWRTRPQRSHLLVIFYALVLFIRCLFLKLSWYVRLSVYVCWPKGEPIRGTQAASSQKNGRFPPFFHRQSTWWFCCSNWVDSSLQPLVSCPVRPP